MRTSNSGPTTDDASAYRLPTTVLPHAYRLTLTPDLGAATFTGEVEIDVSVGLATNQVVLNAAELELTTETRAAVEAAEAFLAKLPETKERMDKVAALIEGYEDPYGMELLSSVHWVMQHEAGTSEDMEKAVAGVRNWNDRKRRLLKPEHLKLAWQRLHDQEWTTVT